MIEIKNLEHTNFDTLFRGFEKAFADYEIHFEKEEVRAMLKRRGYNPQLSFAAFDNDGIVAFTLNGTGTFNGLPTAYDTGTGTAKEFRGQHLAGRIFNESIPFLKRAGIRQYLLEVLQNNQNAINVYRRMNFETTREFDCFRQQLDNIDNTFADTGCTIARTDIASIRATRRFCDFNPSWQNSMESLERGEADLTCMGAFIGNEIVGYCVFDAHTGDLSQIAVDSNFRRRGIGSRMLQEALDNMKTDFIKVLNIESGDTSLPAFLHSKNIPISGKQYEMLLSL